MQTVLSMNAIELIIACAVLRSVSFSRGLDATLKDFARRRCAGGVSSSSPSVPGPPCPCSPGVPPAPDPVDPAPPTPPAAPAPQRSVPRPAPPPIDRVPPQPLYTLPKSLGHRSKCLHSLDTITRSYVTIAKASLRKVEQCI